MYIYNILSSLDLRLKHWNEVKVQQMSVYYNEISKINSGMMKTFKMKEILTKHTNFFMYLKIFKITYKITGYILFKGK